MSQLTRERAFFADLPALYTGRSAKKIGLLLAVAGTVLFPMWSARSAGADTAAQSTTEDAWYRPPPSCGLVNGCGPAAPVPPVSPYPAHTLHVDVTAGVEDARTYLKFDPTTPTDATLTGGAMVLPIAPNADGSLQPETSTVTACLAVEAFAPGEGTMTAPPAVDCATSAPATYTAGPPAALTVDLTPFLLRWKSGAPNDGIALLPASTTAPGTTWHVAFSAHDRTGSDVPPPQITVRYDPPPAPIETAPVGGTPAFDAAAGDVVTGGAALGGGLGSVAVPAPIAGASPIVGQSKLPAVVRRSQSISDVAGPAFAYPVVFAAPLLLLALGGYFGWALTQPVEMNLRVEMNQPVELPQH